MGEILVIYIFISGVLGLPRSLLSIVVFLVGYSVTGGASGSGIFPGISNDNVFWLMFILMAGINTYGIVLNFKAVKIALNKRARK
jgi:hypothetical protein